LKLICILKSKSPAKKPSKLPIFISLAVVGVLVGSYFVFPAVKEFVDEGFQVLTGDDEKAAKEWVAQFGIKGPIVLVVLMIAQMFLFIVPNILLMMIAILSYGPVWGGLLAWGGVFASSTTGYFIGKRLGSPVLQRFMSAKVEKVLIQFVHDYGMGAILLTRLSSFSNDGLSIVAGALRMPYVRYIGSTLTGILPLIVLLAIYGRNGKIEKALLWISIISLVLLAGYIYYDKRKKKKAGASSKS
jgi:uncharacterized membrane protein YdjX (TVP38/TMEM64 family)